MDQRRLDRRLRRKRAQTLRRTPSTTRTTTSSFPTMALSSARSAFIMAVCAIILDYVMTSFVLVIFGVGVIGVLNYLAGGERHQ